MKQVYTIPYGVSYLEPLAKGIIQRYGHDPLALSDVLLLLPNRRACRYMQEAFAQQNAGEPMVLPRIEPIGDINEDIVLSSLDYDEAIMPVSAVEEHMLLTRLVHQWQQRYQTSPVGAGSSASTYGKASKLAKELARFYNEVEREGCGFDALSRLVPETYAEHWQLALEFLSLVSNHWPLILKERGKVSATKYRNNLLQCLATQWQENPPTFPVIAAGTIGNIPATRALLKVVASLPQGSVILPGLDTSLDDAGWEALDPCHPHYGIRQLLATLDVSRQDIAVWHTPASHAMEERSHLFSEVMRPAATTHQWPHFINEKGESFAGVLQGVSYHEAATLQEEALLIAMQMREVLETPEKRAMLVTHDTRLARLVTASLQRWEIAVDNSMGRPLSSGTAYRLLAAVIEVVESDIAPVPLLALLKHPWAAIGEHPAECRRFARMLERYLLRGVRLQGGFGGIVRVLKKMADKAFVEELLPWITKIEQCLAPLVHLFRQKNVSFDRLLETQLRVCEQLAATKDASGSAVLWQGEEGKQLAAYCAEIMQYASSLQEIAPQEYGTLLKSFMAQAVFRQPYGTNTRLAILSPGEAQLLSADRMILSGLNEGSWPSEVMPSPWMNRQMRESFGLPSLDQNIGMAAHDFLQHCFAGEVVLTRARKVDGSPTQPSRWLVRLKTLLEGAGAADVLQPACPWHQWAAVLSQPESFSGAIRPPAPCPPFESRPRELSVTQIEKWMRDPYSIYAAEILQLKPLDPLDVDPSMADFGNFIHEVIDRFLRCYETLPEEDQKEWLLQEGQEWLARKEIQEPVVAFWWPRFERIAEWFMTNEKKRRKLLKAVMPECKLRLTVPAEAAPFTLKARADRIESGTEGNLTIVDYKTGTVPTPADVALGLSPQMPLEGMMLEDGALEAFPQASVAALEYWRLSGSDTAGNVEPLKKSAAILIQEAREGLRALIDAFDHADTPYHAEPWPNKAPNYNDYRHLERVDEWSLV